MHVSLNPGTDFRYRLGRQVSLSPGTDLVGGSALVQVQTLVQVQISQADQFKTCVSSYQL